MKILIVLIAAIVCSCKLTEKRLIGNYNSNWEETLRLNKDKRFDLITPTRQIEGQWTLSGKHLRLVPDIADTTGLANYTLQKWRGKLMRPAHKGPTNRFIIYRKRKQGT